MTNPTPHGQVPEALRLANAVSNLTRYSMDAHLIAAELLRQHARIAELEAQLEATGAGGVQDDLITLRKPTTSAELLWLLKLAHLVISDVDKTLEETFAPAQPAAEASRFGSPELQAMIIARCVEKDKADSVYAFRRKGLEDFCTCDEARYEELSNKPHLFETRVFYTAPQPPTTQAASAQSGASSRKRPIPRIVSRNRCCRYCRPHPAGRRCAADRIPAARCRDIRRRDSRGSRPGSG